MLIKANILHSVVHCSRLYVTLKWHTENKHKENTSESDLVGALSPVNHKGLYQGWKQTSIHLLLIPHKSHETTQFFKIHKFVSTHKKNNQKTVHRHQTHISEEIVSRVSLLLKMHKRLGHAGTMDFCPICRYQIMKLKNLYKRNAKTATTKNIHIMHYDKIPVPYGNMLHVPMTNYHLQAVKQRPYQKAYLLTKNIEELSEKKKCHKNRPVDRKINNNRRRKEH